MTVRFFDLNLYGHDGKTICISTYYSIGSAVLCLRGTYQGVGKLYNLRFVLYGPDSGILRMYILKYVQLR